MLILMDYSIMTVSCIVGAAGQKYLLAYTTGNIISLVETEVSAAINGVKMLVTRRNIALLIYISF